MGTANLKEDKKKKKKKKQLSCTIKVEYDVVLQDQSLLSVKVKDIAGPTKGRV